MTRAPSLELIRGLRLYAESAADLMMPNPVSLRAGTTIKEAIAVLIDRGFSAAPVIDETGRPVGVLSRSDIVVHDREHGSVGVEYYDRAELHTGEGERLGRGFQVEVVDRTEVRDLMTPAVFAVSPETPAVEVVREMLALKVHRLFVVDSAGVLVGVISALDVLRHLRP